MGNRLVCCRWRWVDSPQFHNDDKATAIKYASVDGYANGYMRPCGDNGYVCRMPQQPPPVVPCVTDNGFSHPLAPPLYAPSRPPPHPAHFRPLYDASIRDSWMVRSSEQLQHISEREPEDVENDPSINAKHPTLFLRRSKEDIEMNMHRRRMEEDRRALHSPLRRWSSCSSILLDDTTISQPNPALALKTLALAIHLHVRSDAPADRYRCPRDDAVYHAFDERRHPVIRQGSHTDVNKAPSHREIYRFLRSIFNMAQLTPECAIVTLVYLERLLTSAEMEILPWTWRRQVLASVLLASKVWDDQAVWNADYCQILKDLCVEDVNELERVFLELIQFNINVPSSVYAHYYFDLLQLGRAHGLYNQPTTRHQLTWDRALRLEALNCPSGPLDDYNSRWWTRPRPLSRFLSWDSISAALPLKKAIIS